MSRQQAEIILKTMVKEADMLPPPVRQRRLQALRIDQKKFLGRDLSECIPYLSNKDISRIWENVANQSQREYRFPLTEGQRWLDTLVGGAC